MSRRSSGEVMVSERSLYGKDEGCCHISVFGGCSQNSPCMTPRRPNHCYIGPADTFEVNELCSTVYPSRNVGALLR